MATPDEYDNGDYEGDMVGVQHAKGACEKTKEMIIDMVCKMHKCERR
jgi:hypothetical protein